MKKAYVITFTVLPKNIDKVIKLIEDNRDILVRADWTKAKVQIHGDISGKKK